MTGEELYRLRKDLGDAIGQSISFTDMAKLCGLAPKNGADTIRKWEAGEGPSGPVAVLLMVFSYALEARIVPEGLVTAGAEVLEELSVENPRTVAESVFGVMMLAEVLRRLS